MLPYISLCFFYSISITISQFILLLHFQIVIGFERWEVVRTNMMNLTKGFSHSLLMGWLMLPMGTHLGLILHNTGDTLLNKGTHRNKATRHNKGTHRNKGTRHNKDTLPLATHLLVILVHLLHMPGPMDMAVWGQCLLGVLPLPLLHMVLAISPTDPTEPMAPMELGPMAAMDMLLRCPTGNSRTMASSSMESMESLASMESSASMVRSGSKECICKHDIEGCCVVLIAL